MTIKNLEQEDFEDNAKQFNYQMLNRLQQDCEYFLNHGGGNIKNLWANSIDEQIKEMKKLYNIIEIKPEWLSMEDIENYEKEMKKIKFEF